MKPKIIFGPLPDDTDTFKAWPFTPDFIALEFTAFRERNVNEVAAKRIKATLAPSIKVIGVFEESPIHQILYLLTEDIIDLAFCPQLQPKDGLRIAETTKKPLISAVSPPNPAGFGGIQYLYFEVLPPQAVLNTLPVPYILAADGADDPIVAAVGNTIPPFALWPRKTAPAAMKNLGNIIDSGYAKKRGSL